MTFREECGCRNVSWESRLAKGGVRRREQETPRGRDAYRLFCVARTSHNVWYVSTLRSASLPHRREGIDCVIVSWIACVSGHNDNQERAT